MGNKSMTFFSKTSQMCIRDRFDSWSFHLPFDQTGRCERVAWDEATGTVTFLCTVKTMDGSPIPTGGKMTFSVRQLLTGKKAMEGVTVDLKLSLIHI